MQWKESLTKSLHQTHSNPESRYFQLASVCNKGIPYCRTVVFRGFEQENVLVVVSDLRSEKCNQLGGNPKTQICWYFSKTREQYRFGCDANIVTIDHNNTLVSTQWNKLSDAGKKQFLWGTPGAPKDDSTALHVQGNVNEVPEHFCVILLTINNVDYLNLRGNPQHRVLHQRDDDGRWISQPLIP